MTRYVRCNFCNADDTEVMNHGPDLLLQKPGDFYLVRCRRCGLIYQNPQLSQEELAAHYPDNYLPYQQDTADRQTRIAHVSRDQAIAYIQHRDEEVGREMAQLQAELRAAMDGLRNARHESEMLRRQIEADDR